MFDSSPRDHAEQRRRDAAAGILTLAMATLCAQFAVWAHDQPTFQQALEGLDDDEEIIEIMITEHVDAPDAADLPDAPRPPPPSPDAVPADTPAAVAPTEALPEDMPPEEPDAAEPPDASDEPEQVESSSKFRTATRQDALSGLYRLGAASSDETPHPLAHTVDPDAEYELPSTGLAVRKRRYPEYPPAARAIKGVEHRCLVHVAIAKTGVPYEIEVSGCPDAFHDSARTAVMQWRWSPPTLHTVSVRARTTVEIKYRDYVSTR